MSRKDLIERISRNLACAGYWADGGSTADRKRIARDWYVALPVGEDADWVTDWLEAGVCFPEIAADADSAGFSPETYAAEAARLSVEIGEQINADEDGQREVLRSLLGER